MDKKYIFIKSYTTDSGTIPEGSEIIVFRNTVYFNGGMCHPAYSNILKSIINNEQIRKEYLREQIIEKNEF